MDLCALALPCGQSSARGTLSSATPPEDPEEEKAEDPEEEKGS